MTISGLGGGPSTPAIPASVGPAAWLRSRHPPELFERGRVLIENTFLQTGADRSGAKVAYLHEGLVRGVWHRDKIAPSSRATALVAGDGCWIGVDACKFGENMFRYQALAPTTASLVDPGRMCPGHDHISGTRVPPS